jgi:hypothetical protein
MMTLCLMRMTTKTTTWRAVVETLGGVGTKHPIQGAAKV